MSSNLITLQSVGKSYPILKTGREKFAYVWNCLTDTAPRRTFDALKGIDLQISPGDSYGIIGANGAGKSTLLKLIAGVTFPTAGVLNRRGRVSALLELGAGFHHEYTGRENVHLACALMGLSPTETKARMESILHFADIGDHIDQPIKHYSSGMVVRLGFAVATCITPDILITDEVLAVGDESFQKKCVTWLEKYLAQGGTLLLCSHSMFHIQKMCKKALWLEGGKIKMQGDSFDVTQDYLAWHEEKTLKERVAHLNPVNTHGTSGNPDGSVSAIYCVTEMLLNNDDSTKPTQIRIGDSLRVRGVVFSPDGRSPQVAIGIVRADGSPVYGVVSDMDHVQLQPISPTEYRYDLTFTNIPLLPGSFVARAHAMDPEGMRLFDQVERPFDVKGASREMGFCRLAHEWNHNDQ